MKRGIKAMLMTADDGQEIIRGHLNKGTILDFPCFLY